MHEQPLGVHVLPYHNQRQGDDPMTKHGLSTIRRAIGALEASARDICASGILCYLESSGAGATMLRVCPVADNIVQSSNAHIVLLAKKILQDNIPTMGLDDLDVVLGLARNVDKRHLGAVYTPPYIRQYLVEQAMHMIGDEVVPTILDPSCGGGGFLVTGADLLCDRFEISPEQAWNNHLFGVDVSGDAIESALMMAELHTISRGGNPHSLCARLAVADVATTDPTAMLNSLSKPDGFDIVATNPPFVKIQNMPRTYRAELEKSFPKTATGNYSLSLMFLDRGLDLLKNEGVLAYVVQNNLPTSLAAKSVRQRLHSQHCIRRYIDFGGNQAFLGASAYTALLFAGKTGNHNFFEYGRIDDAVSRLALANLRLEPVEFNSINPSKWRLGYPDQIEIIKKIESTGTPLGRMATIRVGFATLKDSVFLVSEQTVSSMGFEKEVLRPAIKVSAIATQDDIVDNGSFVIYPYKETDLGFSVIDENEMIECFPNVYAWLTGHHHDLSQRDKGKSRVGTWYEWGRPQGRSAPGPKLLTKTFSKTPRFMIDETDSLFCNGYSISLTNRPIPHLLALQLILNSMVMEAYQKITAFEITGGYQCYQKNFIERFGVPEITDDFANTVLDMNKEEIDAYLWRGVYELGD